MLLLPARVVSGSDHQSSRTTPISNRFRLGLGYEYSSARAAASAPASINILLGTPRKLSDISREHVKSEDI